MARFKKHSDAKYYEPSGYNASFDFKGTDFSEYIDFMRTKIQGARLDLRTDYPETIIEANMPFSWLPSKENTDKKRGVLLVHGLFDSPFSLRDLGHVFYQQNFLVQAVLLPGHGTVPGDLLHIHHQSWQEAVAFGVETLQQQVDEVYLCGFSTGGLLCIDYHLRHPEMALKGIVTLAPAFKIKFLAAPLLPTLARISPWLYKRTEDNYTKYRSISLNASTETYRLGREVRKKMLLQNGLKTKWFLAFSVSDFVISAKTCQDLFTHYASPDSICLIFNSHAASENDPRIHYLENIFPNNPPYVLKHNGLPFSPENIHYGLHADYKKEDHGELLYNPDFAKLAKAIVDFL